MSRATQTIVVKDELGREQELRVPCIGLPARDIEKEEGTTLVSDLIEAVRFLIDQNAETLPPEDVRVVTSAIARLEKHDRDSDRHLQMAERCITRMRARIKQAEDEGTVDTRMDIPWVRQELAYHLWAKARV
jgi:hypothetical protein